MERKTKRAKSSRLFSVWKIIVMVSLAVFLQVNSAYSQSDKVRITGTIVDAAGPLGFTNVIEEGTTNGVASDADGNFSIEVSPGSTLKFSQLGYQEYTFVARRAQNIRVEMEEDSQLLDELDVEVNVGYGTQKKSLVTGAISSVSSKEITSTSVSRVDNALNGRTAGVQVVSKSGQPGTGNSIIIRGIGSTTNSEPVFVVDGVIVNNIDYLNPGDVESMEVLKDAASAAIYGSNAANGVVLITTKSGRKGEKARVEYDGYHGWQNPWKKQKVLNAEQYKELINEKRILGGGTPFQFPAKGEGYDTDWQDEVFEKNAPVTSHQLSVSGGSDKTSYLVSGNYFKQNGIIGGDNSYYERISARVNVDSEIKKWLRVGANVIFSYSNSKGVGTGGSYSPLALALAASPLYPVYADDKELEKLPTYATKDPETGQYFNTLSSDRWNSSEIYNPLIVTNLPQQLFKQDYLNGNIFAEIKFIPELKLRSSINYEMEWKRWNGYSQGYYYNSSKNNAQTSAFASTNRYGKWTQDNVLTYDKTFKEAHHFTAMLGTSIYEYKNVNTESSRTNLRFIPDGTHAWVNNGEGNNGNQGSGGGYSDESSVSAFARVNYDYKGRYLFSATFRADGSSKFVGKNKFGYFPSVSGGWVITNENFMQNVKAINFLRLRASWGQNGNKNIYGEYPTVASISSGAVYYFGNVMTDGAYVNKMPNSGLKWETSEQLDIALDMRFFKNRLNLTVDYYRKKTKDQLASEALPGVAAQGYRLDYAAPAVNQGTILNTGVEFNVSWGDKVGDFRYSIGVNGTYNKNTMIDIANEDGIINGGVYTKRGDLITRCEEGKSAWYFYGWKTDGLFQTQEQVDAWLADMEAKKQVSGVEYSGNSFYGMTNIQPGDLIFVDQNGDGIIDDQDRTELGSPYAKFQLGVNLSFEYKGFDLGIQGYGRFGQKIYNGTYRYDAPIANMPVKFLDRWTPDNSNTNIPRLSTENYTKFTDFYLEDGSFFRISSIQLGYTFPKKWMNTIYVESLRIYVAVENPWTFTKYTGLDPEVSSDGAGIDFGTYPVARTIRVGGTLTF